MLRQVVGRHDDELGGRVADLSCLHEQAEPGGVGSQAERRPSELECSRCDAAELPGGLGVLRTTGVWDGTTVPRALTRRHRVAARRWAVIRVLEGEVGFWAGTSPVIETVVAAGATQPIPPEVDHHIVLVGPVRFCIDFLGRPDDGTEG